MRALFLFLFLMLPLGATADLIADGFVAAQLATSSSAGSALRQTATRRAEGDGPLADLLRSRQAASNRAERLERDLTAADRDDPARVIRLAGEVETVRTQLTELDAKIAENFPGFATFSQPQPLDLESSQQLLDADEALVFVFTGAHETHVWALTTDQAAWYEIGLGEDAISDAVQQVRQSLGQSALLRAAAPLEDDPEPKTFTTFDFEMSWLIYRELFAQLMPLLEATEHVYFVLDGPLSALPVSLLVTDEVPYAGQMTPQAFRETHWMFQRFAITVLPSVESLALIKGQAPRPRENLHLIGFGDPLLTGGYWPGRGRSVMKGALADPNALRALAPLPATRRELRLISSAFPKSELYLAEDATEATLRSADLGAADVLAFATHGLLTGELEGLSEPALVLTPPDIAAPFNDGLLTASEIAGLDLNADWVVLSACNTAGGDGRPDADGLSGLARAFLFAGARTLVVSHWPVRDDAAAQLTTDMFQTWTHAPDRRKATALQIAMQAMLMDDNDPSLAHPSAWAPFILVGDGG